MEINVEVCEPLSAATRRGLSNKLCAERESSPQLWVETSYADEDGERTQTLMQSRSELIGCDWL